MNFDLSDDQRMLKDSVERLVSERYQLEQRKAYSEEPNGHSQAVWSEMVELGLTMLPFAEEHGGLGLGGVESLIVGEAFGRGLVIEPYLPSVVLAGKAIAEGSGDQAADLLGSIMAGATLAALADRAEVSSDGGPLNGSATVVLGGDVANLLVVPEGAGAWLVNADAPGVDVRAYRLHGGGGAADITFSDVSLDNAQRLSDGCVAAALDAGIAFLAAEASGAMQAGFDITVEYLKTREQFGKPIGTNQALQHKAAEMLVEVEQARSAAIYAALLAYSDNADERSKGMAAVKAVIGKAGRFVAQNVVQLHGGIGVSEEHIASHYFRRLTAIGMLLGGTDEHVKRLAEADGFTGVDEHLAA